MKTYVLAVMTSKCLATEVRKGTTQVSSLSHDVEPTTAAAVWWDRKVRTSSINQNEYSSSLEPSRWYSQ